MLKTAPAIGPVAGDQVTYQLSITNNGPSVARSVTVGDPLPAGTTFVSAVPSTGTCDGSTATITCSFGDLGPGGVVTVQLVARLAADLGGTTLTNTASTSSSTADPVADNNS